MNKYVLINKKENKAVITKNGEIVWEIKFNQNLSSYGYSAKTSSGDSFVLESKGLFWWRNITLFKNAKEIEKFKVNKSLQSNVSIDSRKFIYRNRDYLFSLDRANYGNVGNEAWFSWSADIDDIEPVVFTLAILSVQRRKPISSITAGMVLGNDI